jgi:hypothetical protein
MSPHALGLSPPLSTICGCFAGEPEFETLDKLDRLEVFEEYIR